VQQVDYLTEINARCTVNKTLKGIYVVAAMNKFTGAEKACSSK
jgi:hypothetical protein